jgi:HK97 family phage portal protein
MSKRRRSRLVKAVTQTNLTDIYNSLSSVVYAMGKRAILPRLAAEIGARQATIQALAEQKAYDEIGNTEISSFINSTWSEQPKQNLQILANLYETHPWVKICTSWIAEALAGIPLRVYKATGFEDGKEVLEPYDESPVGRMFRWVNPQQSPAQFTEELAAWLLLTGEAYVVHTIPGPGTPRGIPHELYVLFTPFVEKVVSPRFGLIGYNYNVSGETSSFLADDVTYFSNFSPAGRYRGQGAVTAGYKTIQSDQELRDFNRNVLTQGIHLSGVLETDNEDLGKEDADVIRDSFEKQYAGSAKAAKLAVLWGGLKFSPQTILQKDVMMTEQLVASRDEIIALYGLKPELLTEKFANKATAETVRRMAYEDTVLGRWGKRIESIWGSTGLLRYDPDLRVRFDTSQVPALQTSNREKVETAAVAIGAGMTVNEARDTIKKGFGVTCSKANEDRIIFSRLQKTADDRLQRALLSIYREIGKEVRNIATRSEVYSKVLVDLEQVFFFDGRTAVVKTVSESVRQAIDDAVELELSRMAKLGVEGVFDVKPVRALSRLTSQEQRIRNMMSREWTDLRKEISDGLAMGESQAKLGQRVGGFFEGMRNNAATIARTETVPAINGATMDVGIGARKAGVDIVSVWITAQDELVRRPASGGTKDHARAHGLTIIPGEELFVVSGQRLEYPGDSWNGATADNTINCRCGVVNEVRKPNASDDRGEI